MGFNMNPNILSGEYSAVHNNNTPILYKKDKKTIQIQHIRTFCSGI